MKKLFLMANALLFFSFSNAQNTFPTTGNVGIGTSQPQSPLHINADQSALLSLTNHSVGNQQSSGETSIYMGDGGAGINMLRASKRTFNTRAFEIWTEYGYSTPHKSADFYHDYINLYTNDANRMTIDVNGNIGIGTGAPDQKLTVSGIIHAKEIKVDLNVPGPDYVFKPNYELPGLAEIKTFIAKNHHLPEIPSAIKMSSDGVNLGEMNIKLLKKIEELTLYIIKQDQNQQLQNKINKNIQHQLKKLKYRSNVNK